LIALLLRRESFCRANRGREEEETTSEERKRYSTERPVADTEVLIELAPSLGDLSILCTVVIHLIDILGGRVQLFEVSNLARVVRTRQERDKRTLNRRA